MREGNGKNVPISDKVLPVALIPELLRLPGCFGPEKTLLTLFLNIFGEINRSLAEPSAQGQKINYINVEIVEHAFARTPARPIGAKLLRRLNVLSLINIYVTYESSTSHTI